MRLNFRAKRSGTIDRQGISSAPPRSELVVVLHGLMEAAYLVDSVVDPVKEVCPDADIWAPWLPWWNPLAISRPETVLRKLREDLDRIWNNGEYKSLRIVGHSIGGVYARALLLEGRKELERCERAAGGKRYWADSQADDRLIVLAAVNRGAGLTHHMGPFRVMLVLLGSMVAALMRLVFLRPTVSSVERGSVFLTRLRLSWLEEDHARPLPLTVQLLGSQDDIVGPSDSIDMITGAHFIYLDVPHTGHGSIISMGYGARGASLEQSVRRKSLTRALTLSVPELQELQVRPWHLKSPTEEEIKARGAVDHVVFVIHGIRDEGYWTDKVARKIWEKAHRPSSMEKVVDSYGYFGMGPFLLPFVRRKKVEWLMEVTAHPT